MFSMTSRVEFKHGTQFSPSCSVSKHAPYVVLWILLASFARHVFVFVEMCIAEDAKNGNRFRKNHTDSAHGLCELW